MTMIKGLLVALGVALASPAVAWTEPARGSDLRADLMDAMRPIAEWSLGAPVQFVVHQLRVQGDVAFASVMMQRPGGAAIDMRNTPGYRSGEIDLNLSDGATMQALFQRSGRQWVAVHHVMGATDVWYAYDGFCPIWRPVLTEICR